jgi:hypothetical protein
MLYNNQNQAVSNVVSDVTCNCPLLVKYQIKSLLVDGITADNLASQLLNSK